jgi:hypothetical protein
MVLWTLLGISILSGVASFAGRDAFNIVDRSCGIWIFLSGPIFWLILLKKGFK